MERVRVVIHAEDLLSAAGAVAQLRGQTAVDIVPSPPDAAGGPVVAVVVGWQVDAALLARCRKLARSEGLRVVLVVSRMRESELMRVIECGVSNVLWRHEATTPRLVAAVLGAHRGEGDIPPDLLGRLLTQIGSTRGRGDRTATVYGLTEREVEILRLIAEGLDTKEIADKISYSERTVKSVLQGVMSRLKLRNRAQAVAYAAREGYI